MSAKAAISLVRTTLAKAIGSPTLIDEIELKN